MNFGTKVRSPAGAESCPLLPTLEENRNSSVFTSLDDRASVRTLEIPNEITPNDLF